MVSDGCHHMVLYQKNVNDIAYAFGREILQKVVRNFKIPEASDPVYSRTVPLHIRVGNWIHDKDGKTKRKFIKYYHTEAKKLINKQLIDKINKAVSSVDSLRAFGHDEILLHNFKIVNSKLILSSDPDIAEKMWKNAEKAGMTKFDVIDQSEVAKL